MAQELSAILMEWFTGRSLDNRESLKFASRWKIVGRMRSYNPHIADLRGALRGVADKVIVNLAVGSDDETDLRIETFSRARGESRQQTFTSLGVVRWRPVNGDLSRAIERGKTHKTRIACVRNPDAIANSNRVSQLSEQEAYDVVRAVRAELVLLHEKREALVLAGRDTKAVDAAIADHVLKRAAARARFAEVGRR